MSAPRHRATPPASLPQRFRPDIEGLRAVAVGSVLLYHAGLVWVSGGYVGVDVFFVISGFLITSLMIREVERHGRLRLADFWGRRARRLLPASTLVLVFTAVVTYLWLPVTSRKEFGGDVVAAAWYVVNWRLGHREVDYLAENVGASPVQHYWSLAVEEQFYVVWPLLISLLVLAFRSRWRLALLLGIGAVSAASFAYTLDFAVARPGLAFFYSSSRVWELGVGALLAIGYPELVRIPARARTVLGWVGLAMIAVAILTFDGTTTWPGNATLLPVLGTAAAILAGGGQVAGRGIGVVLGRAPAVWLGGLSYSLYLWHWPFLIAAEGVWGDLRVRDGLIVVALSVVPAWLSHRYIENPLRRSPRLALPRRALVGGAVGMGIASVAGAVVVASFGWLQTVDVATAAEAPGARALADPAYADVDWGRVEHVDRVRPSPLKALQDIPRTIYNTDCVVHEDVERFEACDFGDPHADRTVVLVGDSKAIQWFTPLNRIAKREGWRLVVIGKNTCAFAEVTRLLKDHRNDTCERWGARALEKIKELQPELVLTVTHYSASLPKGGSSEADYQRKPMVDGLASRWRDVLDAGADLVPILDTPGPRGAVPECIQEHPDHLTACSFDKASALEQSGAPAQLEAAEAVDVPVVDMSPVTCPDGSTCPAVIGNVVVYRAGTHLANTFAASATARLAAELAEATHGRFGAGAAAEGDQTAADGQ